MDLIGDADEARYRAAVSACLADPQVDGVLAILTPQAMTNPEAAARAVIDAAHSAQNGSSKPLLTAWMGEASVADARELFRQARIPTFRAPEPAIETFAHLSSFYRNQHLLMQAPGPLASTAPPDLAGAKLIIEIALAERRKVLSEMESKALLASFHIPIAKTVLTRSANEAMLVAQELGFPVAMKIDSPDITHKSDAGGVSLDLGTAQAVRAAYQNLVEEVAKCRPDAQITGVALEPMVRRPHGRELMIGVLRDAVFGPAISFGSGGTAVEVHADRAVALPPLNGVLAANLIDSTQVTRLLGAFRHMPPVDRAALEGVLLRVSEMVCELPWIQEMDINPLIADENGVIAADARIVIDNLPPMANRYSHMAIHPYPAHLAFEWPVKGGVTVTVRPIGPRTRRSNRRSCAACLPRANTFASWTP